MTFFREPLGMSSNIMYQIELDCTPLQGDA